MPVIRYHFNPRSREGSDLSLDATTGGLLYFNPRSREGSDLKQCVSLVETRIFQSTLP